MALPTCECVKGLPIGEQLAAIYCATKEFAESPSSQLSEDEVAAIQEADSPSSTNPFATIADIKPVFLKLALNQSTNTNALAPVTGMAFDLPAGEYELGGLWSFSNSAGGTGARVNLLFSQNLSTTWKFSAIPDSGSQTPVFNSFSNAAQGNIGDADATGQFSVIELHRARITVPSLTTITVEFAQSTLNAGINTIMLAGSYVTARRLSF